MSVDWSSLLIEAHHGQWCAVVVGSVGCGQMPYMITSDWEGGAGMRRKWNALSPDMAEISACFLVEATRADIPHLVGRIKTNTIQMPFPNICFTGEG